MALGRPSVMVWCVQLQDTHGLLCMISFVRAQGGRDWEAQRIYQCQAGSWWRCLFLHVAAVPVKETDVLPCHCCPVLPGLSCPVTAPLATLSCPVFSCFVLSPCPPSGITLSPKQVARGTQLARERGLNNVTFKVCACHVGGIGCVCVGGGRTAAQGNVWW